MTETGIKYDQNKLRFDLIDPHFHKDVAEVLSFGAAKYGPNNWQKLEDARNRYIGAAERHLNAIKRGELLDEETGLLHAAHLGCNAMFLHYLDRVTTPMTITEVANHGLHVTRQDIVKETSTGWAKRVLKGIYNVKCSTAICYKPIKPADEYYELTKDEDTSIVICVRCHDHLEAETNGN